METTAAPIVEFTDLVVATPGTARQYGTNRLTIARGDVIVIIPDEIEDAGHLLRVIATLEQPAGGRYRFDGARVELDDYRKCLAVKRRIGYVAPDAAMISNRTLWENLLLARFYHENDLSIDIDATTRSLCRDANLLQRLDWRPSLLSGTELLKAITIREMGKGPAVMLVDRPENYMDISEDDGIFNHLKYMVKAGAAVVFYSANSGMTDLANRQLTMAGGAIRTRSV
jgi:ABC-type lipoprotein export system ATPase subunit